MDTDLEVRAVISDCVKIFLQAMEKSTPHARLAMKSHLLHSEMDPRLVIELIKAMDKLEP